jgi:hypothetical protein
MIWYKSFGVEYNIQHIHIVVENEARSSFVFVPLLWQLNIYSFWEIPMCIVLLHYKHETEALLSSTRNITSNDYCIRLPWHWVGSPTASTLNSTGSLKTDELSIKSIYSSEPRLQVSPPFASNKTIQCTLHQSLPQQTFEFGSSWSFIVG